MEYAVSDGTKKEEVRRLGQFGDLVCFGVRYKVVATEDRVACDVGTALKSLPTRRIVSSTIDILVK